MSGDPGLRRAQTRQSALNFVVCAVLFRLFGTVGLFNKLQTQVLFRSFRMLEVISVAVRPVMTVYWGWEAVTLVVCHKGTCVAAGSPIMHSFCGRLGPGTSPKCARNEIWTVYAAYTEMDGSSESNWLLGMACKVVGF